MFCSHNLPFQNPVSSVESGGCKERGACVCRCRQDMGHFAFCATGLSLQKQERFTEAAPHRPRRPSTLSPPQPGASSSVAAPRPWLGALQDSGQSHPPPAPLCHGRRGTFLAPPCLFALCGVSKRDACLLHASNIHSDAAL